MGVLLKLNIIIIKRNESNEIWGDSCAGQRMQQNQGNIKIIMIKRNKSYHSLFVLFVAQNVVHNGKVRLEREQAGHTSTRRYPMHYAAGWKVKKKEK